MTELRELRRPDGATIAWREDDFGDPWQPRPAVLLLHGIAENGDAFRGWVPHLARRHRVVRMDLRGHGRSSAVDPRQPLRLETLAEDVEAVVAALGADAVHVVGAKLGAQAALLLAQQHPGWMASLSVAGVLISPSQTLGPWVERWCAMVDEGGVRGWAAATMRGRMGASMPPAGIAWWSTFMGAAPAESVKACFRMLPGIQEPTRLENIQCPTQVLVAAQDADTASFDQRQPVEEVRRWQQRIRGSRLCEVKADSYHIAASHPDACARAVADFIGGHSA